MSQSKTHPTEKKNIIVAVDLITLDWMLFVVSVVVFFSVCFASGDSSTNTTCIDETVRWRASFEKMLGDSETKKEDFVKSCVQWFNRMNETGCPVPPKGEEVPPKYAKFFSNAKSFAVFLSLAWELHRDPEAKELKETFGVGDKNTWCEKESQMFERLLNAFSPDEATVLDELVREGAMCKNWDNTVKLKRGAWVLIVLSLISSNSFINFSFAYQ